MPLYQNSIYVVPEMGSQPFNCELGKLHGAKQILKQVNCHLKPSGSLKIFMLPSTKTGAL